MEDKTNILLSEMYRNVKTGSAGIVSVLPKVDDRFMIRELARDLERCESYTRSVGNMIHSRGGELRELPASARLRLRAGRLLQLLCLCQSTFDPAGDSQCGSGKNPILQPPLLAAGQRGGGLVSL